MLLIEGAGPWPEMPISSSPTAGPLADYVSAADPEYGWQVQRRGEHGDGRYAELILTSQRWQNALWRHQLFIYRPAQVRDPSRAILLIDGGNWHDDLAAASEANNPHLDAAAAQAVALSDRLGTPIAVVRQVPAQPLFADGLLEDAAIAHTFQKFLDTEDISWPLLLPMVKSAVRAMDAVGEFAAREWSLAPTKFTLSGASKRGWTTWLSAAVDPRVVALAPQVIDLLNLPRHMVLQLQTWGTFSELLADYTQRNLQLQLLSPAGQKLLQTVDPYHYLDHLRQPKFLLLGTNDRYWPLEALNLYWDALPGDKYVHYLPNSGHDLNDPARVLGGIGAITRHAAGELTLPKMSWDFAEDGAGLGLTLRSNVRPAVARVWTASAETRDFRDAVWSATILELHDGEYRYHLPMPTDGCAALLGELQFDDPVLPYYLSSTVRVVPAL